MVGTIQSVLFLNVGSALPVFLHNLIGDGDDFRLR